MANIYNLPRTADAASSDLLAVWSQALGAEAAMPFSAFLTYIQANTAQGSLRTQYAAPSATGFSVTVTAGNTHLLMTPGAAYAAGTVVLPTASDGQVLTITSTQAVSTLTLSGAEVHGEPTGLSANGFYTIRYDAVTGAWYRIS